MLKLLLLLLLNHMLVRTAVEAEDENTDERKADILFFFAFVFVYSC